MADRHAAQPSPAQPHPSHLDATSVACPRLTGRDDERLGRVVEVLFGPREVAHQGQLAGGTREMKAYSNIIADVCQLLHCFRR